MESNPIPDSSKEIIKKWLSAVRETQNVPTIVPDTNFQELMLQELKLFNAISTEHLAQLYKLNAKTDNALRTAYIILGAGLICLIYFMAH
jgi:hypothetical protein